MAVKYPQFGDDLWQGRLFIHLCGLVRMAREQQKKVRQRYDILTIYIPNGKDEEVMDGWVSELEDECNVRCCLIKPQSQLKGEREIKLNFPKIGKRIPGRVKEIASKIKSGDYSVLSELKEGEYTESFKPSGVFYKDEYYTVVLEKEIDDGWRERKSKMKIQKDTFHDLKVSLGGWDDKILDTYHPDYTDQPPQRRMDIFEFDTKQFI